MAEADHCTSAPASARVSEPLARRRPRARVAVLLVAPIMLLSACNILKPIEDLFGLGKNELATPQFQVGNGVQVQVVVSATQGQGGLPITVHVHCVGGTTASATFVLQSNGSLSLGQTTFNPTWPAGADCVVSQEIVKNVGVATTTLTWVNAHLLRASFLNK